MAPQPGLESLKDEHFCYRTTTGRVSGLPRESEIWSGVEGHALYMLSGGREGSNWVKNIKKDPEVTVRIAGRTYRGKGRIVTDGTEDALARNAASRPVTGR